MLSSLPEIEKTLTVQDSTLKKDLQTWDNTLQGIEARQKSVEARLRELVARHAISA